MKPGSITEWEVAERDRGRRVATPLEEDSMAGVWKMVQKGDCCRR